MADLTHKAKSPLHILHVFRAPLGGLFRHVCDLVEGQRKAGHKVGIICGELPGDKVAADRLARISGLCDLGVHTIEINRLPGVSDIGNIFRVMSCVMRLKADVIHGHGAKGGAYVRLLPRIVGGSRIYTPHGGSLHFDPRSLQGFAVLLAERFMRHRTDAFVFESDFGLRTFIKKVGDPSTFSTVIPNGVTSAEFAAVEPEDDAADFVFVGELRELKGVGTLIDAATLAGHPMHLRIVGSGVDRALFEAQAATVPPCVKIEFMGSMPAREAFKLGRMVVVPSYHESLPYVVLEAAAAGMPVIATRVGGMSEIFGPDSCTLLTPRDIGGLSDRMRYALNHPDEMKALAGRLRARVSAEFSSTQMVDGVNTLYRRLVEPGAPQPLRIGDGQTSGIEGVSS
jgi:glycosyltransferase involved in cell wall biosynthesis